jgi:hypothetical protein
MTPVRLARLWRGTSYYGAHYMLPAILLSRYFAISEQSWRFALRRNPVNKTDGTGCEAREIPKPKRLIFSQNLKRYLNRIKRYLIPSKKRTGLEKRQAKSEE